MIDEAEGMLLHGIVRGEMNQERNVVEYKIAPEQEKMMDPETMTHMDPITKETGDQLDANGKSKIEITTSSGNSDPAR